MIAVIDSGSNIASILCALKRLNKAVQLTTDKEIIQAASHVILPGVGTAAYAMQQLQRYELISTLQSLTQPVLGICLGMQLLYEYSTEGEVNCLGLIPGIINRFTQTRFPIPHMGWNTIQPCVKTALLSQIPSDAYVYFVHSFIAPINSCTLATADHGQTFTAIAQYKNFYGMQFHPERSGTLGTQLLENFLRL